MSTTLALGRPRVRQGVTKSGGDPSRFSDFDIDFAIRTYGNDFVNRTRCTRTISTLDFLLNNPSVDFSGLTGFSPDMLIETAALVVSSDWATAVLTTGTVTSITVNYSPIYTTAPAVTFSGGGYTTTAVATANLTLGRITSFTISNAGTGYTSVPTVLLDGVANNYTPAEVADGIEIPGIGDLRYLQRCSETGTPTHLAFNNLTTAQVYPTPKADGALSVIWSPPFTDFVPGTQGAYSASVNYYLGDVVSSGGILYTCIQSGIAQTPASSPLYWTSLGAGTLTAPASVTLNIPDTLIDGVLFFGAGCGLVAPLSEVADKTGIMAAYERHVFNSMGRGGLGAKVFHRSMGD